MIDTHTHLYLEDFAEEGAASVVDRGYTAGVSKMIMPNVGVSTVEPLMNLKAQRPEIVSVALGLHPTEVDTEWQYAAESILRMSGNVDCVAVGEIGIDLYWDKTFRDYQMQAFEYQIDYALKANLPVIIHCREALDETLEVLMGFHGKMPDLIFHSFTGSTSDVDKIRKVTDPMFGINGVVTFKNAKPLHEAVPHITLQRILLETDSPYLSPVPKRGKRNESSYLPYINAKIAEILEKDKEEVEAATDINAISTFRL